MGKGRPATVGDIHWGQLPAANGCERRGRRPAVILQDERYAGGLSVVLVVPRTTTRAALRFAGTTLIQPTVENGLRQASVALVFQVRAIDRRRVQERIGSVSAEVLHAMFAELDTLMGRAEEHGFVGQPILLIAHHANKTRKGEIIADHRCCRYGTLAVFVAGQRLPSWSRRFRACSKARHLISTGSPITSL